MEPIALTIAGSDSSGGAGIQADLKTFTAFGVYGASVITALTAQNTRGVHGVAAVEPKFVAAQFRSVLDDLDVKAIKTGMLANAAIIQAVVEGLATTRGIPIVVDPVMVATSGDPLLESDAVEAVRRQLLPIATLITPNIPEAACLLDATPARSIPEAEAQARALVGLGARAVLLKGGHGEGEAAVDLLLDADGLLHRLEAPRLATPHTHGTGCTLSAAIAALLASGSGLDTAVRRAKSYVFQAIGARIDRPLGHGNGPVDHLYAIRRQELPA